MFFEIFKESSYSDSTALLKKVLFLFINLQLLLQNINFFWQPTLPVPDWSKYITFWTFLNFPCIDSLAVALNVSPVFVFTVFSLVCFVSSSFVVSFIMGALNKKVPLILLFLVRICMEFLYNLYYIPCTIALVTLIKYSTSQYQYLEEYTSLPPGTILDFGEFGRIAGSLALTLHTVLAVAYEISSCNMKYSLKNNFYSVSSPYVNIYLKLFLLAQCIMFTTIQLENFNLFMEFNTALYFITSLILLYYVPYHSLFANAVRFTVFLDSTLISLSFLLAVLLESAQLPLTLSIVLQPFLIYTSYEVVKYRIGRFKPIDTPEILSFTSFEHSARKHLITGDKDSTMLRAMNFQLDGNKSKLAHVLTANYCLEALKDSELAQIKIGKVETFTLDLPVMFSVYKCKREILERNLKESKALNWVIFFINLEDTMKIDRALCNSLMSLYRGLVQPGQKLDYLKNAVCTSHRLLKQAKEGYTKLLELFPDSPYVLEMYGLFLIDLEDSRELGLAYFNKSRQPTRNFTSLLNLSTSNNETCRFIVSGNPGNLGTILYANITALEFLGISKESLKNTDIFQFLPGPLRKKHTKNLARFAERCISSKIPCNIFPFLYINGYCT